MKNLFLLFVFLSLLTACSRPQNLLEKGKNEKAFKASLFRLQSGKVRTKHLAVFEQSFNNLNERDAQVVDYLKADGRSKKWLEIYNLSLEITERQRKTQKIFNRVQRKGFYPELDWYPSEELKEEAEYNVALFYYDEAQSLIPLAKRGNKKAAREAYYLFQECQKYKANFKDAFELEEEMYHLGTTNIVLEPLETDLQFRVSDLLFNSFLRKQKFPKRDEWNVYHLIAPKDREVDFELAFYFDDLFDSGENVSQDFCSNTKTIKVGEKNVKEWSAKDSAYVEVIVPVFETVKVNVTTYHQSKNVSLKLFCEIIDAKSGDHIDDFSLYNSSCWTNNYSEVSGDCRALDSRCSSSGGCRQFPPNTMNTLSEIANCMKRSFYKNAKKKII